jgi:hypothetical protein
MSAIRLPGQFSCTPAPVGRTLCLLLACSQIIPASQPWLPSFTMLIGVLALQGAFLEHIDKFRSIGVAAKEVSHANTMYRE